MRTNRLLRRNLGRVPLCLLVVCTVFGCSNGVQVRIHWGPVIKYSGFGPTFAWVRGPDDIAASEQALYALIVDTTETELIRRGYVANTTGNPELKIDYKIIKQDKTDATGIALREQGTLVLDMIDTASGQRYWRGIAEATLYDDASPEVRRQRVSEAIRAMLAEFPAADRQINNP